MPSSCLLSTWHCSSFPAGQCSKQCSWDSPRHQQVSLVFHCAWGLCMRVLCCNLTVPSGLWGSIRIPMPRPEALSRIRKKKGKINVCKATRIYLWEICRNINIKLLDFRRKKIRSEWLTSCRADQARKPWDTSSLSDFVQHLSPQRGNSQDGYSDL
jgi:hypothetical protein